MVSLEHLQKLKTNCVFINASRGGVVNNNDLAEVLKIRKDLKVWLDVFEGEPSIDNHELLSLVDGATAHIAGYSYESKRRANVMLADTMSKLLNLKEPAVYTMPVPEVVSMEIGEIENLDLDLISRLVFSVYDVRRDSNKFKANFTDGKSFDAMRQSYRERRELSSLSLLNVPQQFKETLSLLGFRVK
jgi:erythronate-4-phosphate dehydrogenase